MIDPLLARARAFLEAEVLDVSDVHSVGLVAPRFGETDTERLLGLCFAARAPRAGHAGVDLRGIEVAIEASRAERQRDGEATTRLPWPDRGTWMDLAGGSPLVGAPLEADTPFVWQDTARGPLLLTRRMYAEQERIAAALQRLASGKAHEGSRLADVEGTCARLFPEEPRGEAANVLRIAATSRLALVVGGPGTGKTYSLARLVAALLEQEDPSRPLSIELAAPTGKAGVRMREAILDATRPDARPPLPVDPRVRARLRELSPRTLHSLLGVRSDGGVWHDRERPLPADVVVVDEVSMVDLFLMRRLVEAVPDHARLVLLGDRDQLASVEAGCVLADLVGSGGSGALSGSAQLFSRSRRFEDAPDVAFVAACLQSYPTTHPDAPGTAVAKLERAVDVLVGRAHATAETSPAERIRHLGAPVADERRSRPSDAQVRALAHGYLQGHDWLGGERRDGYGALLRRAFEAGAGAFADPALQQSLLDALARYRVLCVHRKGPLGVEQLDRVLGEEVRRFVGPERTGEGRHWLGRPLLVTENAYELGLFNGDVGIVLPGPEGRVAVFPGDGGGPPRAVAPSRLPPTEGALAMTVHKSQGSQFDAVALVLSGGPSPIQTRELVYTAVTRARNRLLWLGEEAELRDALFRRVERASGLEDLLRAPAR